MGTKLSSIGKCAFRSSRSPGVWMATAFVLAMLLAPSAPAWAATWGPSTSMQGESIRPTDTYNGSCVVGAYSTADLSQSRAIYHWTGTGVNTPLNANISTTGGTLIDSCSAVYSATASANIRAYRLSSEWTWYATWLHRYVAGDLHWATAGGDIDTILQNVTVVNVGTYTWTWTTAATAGYGILLFNTTSGSSITYRKTFANSGVSLTLTYTPPADSAIQDWSRIGFYSNTDPAVPGTRMTTDYFAADSSGTETGMYASTGKTYNGNTWAVHNGSTDIVDLKGVYGNLEMGAAYLFTYITNNTGSAKTVYLGLGSDDGMKVWLNGTVVSTQDVYRGVTPDNEFVGPFTLNTGVNRLLVKVTQGAGATTGNGYAAYVRLANADRSALSMTNIVLTSSDDAAPGITSVTSPAYDNTSPIAVSYVTAADNLSGLKDVTLWVKKGTGAWAATAVTSTSASGTLSYTGMTGNDTYYFGIVTRDNALNSSTTPSGSGSDSTIYDVAPPTGSIGSPSPASVCSGGVTSYPVTYADTGGSGIASVSLLTSDVTVTNVSGTASATVDSITSGTTATPTVNLTTSGSGTLKITIAAGRAADNAGNTDLGATTTNYVTVLAAPVITANAVGGSNLTGQTNASYTISPVAIGDAAGYGCVVSMASKPLGTRSSSNCALITLDLRHCLITAYTPLFGKIS